MSRFPLSSLFALVLAAVAPVTLRAAETKPVRSWSDPVLKVTFPRKLAGLEIRSRSTYGRGDLDYSLGYKSSDDDMSVNGEWLDVYVYTREGKDAVQENVESEASAALSMVRRLMEGHGASFSADSRRLVQVWDRTGFTNSVALCEYAGGKVGGRTASVISVTAHAGRFVKLRYSVPTGAGDYVPARRFGEICSALDSLFAESARREKMDVYAAEGAEALLEKLREKWPGAGETVSQWKMPGTVGLVAELDAASRWCAEEYAGRIKEFENVSRRGIESKTDPETWYYNLACALSMQKRADEAFEALEQAVAAGFDDAGHAEEDEDFANIKSDARFARLVAAMRVVAAKAPPLGVEPLHPAGGDCIVGEENVRYVHFAQSYLCAIDTADRKTVVYIGNDQGRAAPCEGLLTPSFEEEADDSGAIAETACFHFAYDPDGKGRELWCPTIVASAAGEEEDFFACIPATLAADGGDANREQCHEQWNVLGVYAAKGFGADGTDPLPFWSPGFIAHSGGAEDGDKFVKLAADIIRAMPFEVIEDGFPVGQLVQKIIRSSQKGVEGEEGFKSGLAMRPVLDFADVDVDRAVAAAKSLDPKRLPPLSPYFKNAGSAFSPPPMYVEFSMVHSAHHVGVLPNWLARRGVLDVELELVGEGVGVEWKVLAGDASRVSFEPAESGHTRICIDWHDPFEEEFPSGRRLKSARVDIGCFAVRDGVASMPSVVSVYFPPTQHREYDPDGRPRFVDYTDRKWPGILFGACPRGDWRDEPHYFGDKEGELTGWTRYRTSADGGVSTEEFTEDGLVVMTRDELGRPKRCRKDLRAEWYQTLPAYPDAKEVDEAYTLLSAKYDTLSEPPEGDNATTLVWEYDYGEANGTKKLRPVAPVRFRRRPELCPAADFGAESGFGLPLLAQVRIGYGIYSEYKAGRVPQPPSARTKLRFAKGVPSDKSRWPADADEFEEEAAKHLHELADGACRATANAGGGNEGPGEYISVEWTRFTLNRASEYAAFSGMNKFQRCSEDETLAALSSRTNDLDLAKVHVNGGPVPLEDGALPKGKSVSCAMWEITNTLRFGVITDFNSRFVGSRYFFCMVGKSGEALTWDWFEEFPSRAIGDTMLMAACHDPDAVNNLAVLMHAGVCNPGSRSRPAVEKLLEFAANGGCAAAAENLKALRGGNGEKAKAPPPPPELVGSMMGEYTQACDIWDERWDLPFRERTPMRHVYCWNGAESTVRITATVEAQEGELRWKLIQGDPEKVRITPLGNGTGSVRAEIDWHGAYLVRGRDGKTRRTTRVEFGCVAVKDGLESEPCVVSVSASPHATREYDEAGWLRKIDYRTPLLKGKVSARFPLGDWADVFEYTPDGRLAGWTRLRTDESGAEVKEHFTRDGLKILTYDAIGRPLRCERDYRATLYQRTARGERSDHSGCVPEQFEYRYGGKEDFLGHARPAGRPAASQR